MARQQNIFVTGKLSNMIFYTFNGKPCVRMMPDKVRQTEATRKSASLFGKAASMTSAIRKELRPVYADLPQTSVMQRLNAAMVKYLGSKGALAAGFVQQLEYLALFDFNKDHPLSSRLKVYPEVLFDNKGKMKLSFANRSRKEMITMPSAAGFIQIQLAGIAFTPDKPIEYKSWKYESGIVPVIDPQDDLSLPFTNRKGQMIIIGASIRYFKSRDQNTMITQLNWMPSGIVSAVWTGKG